MVSIKLLFFASARDLFGRAADSWQLDQGATLGIVKSLLLEKNYIMRNGNFQPNIIEISQNYTKQILLEKDKI